MKFRSLMTAICVLATANIVSAAPFAYIANSGTNNVSVIRTDTNAVTATVPLPTGGQPYPYSVAVSPSGQYVYVGIQGTNKIAIIDAATNTLLPQSINLGADKPGGLAINAAETRLYVASNMSNTLIAIDITNIKVGSGLISEVGRVTVHSASISNPEGVVLSPDGLKAYVANSTQASIAEISLNEADNIYTRTELIALGNNAQPMGLTINSTGTKLYAAGFNGHASVIDTASRVATDLPLGSGTPFVLHGTGNLSVAITPDDNKIYAPSAGYNNLYVVNGTTNGVTELGLQNSLLNSPWGSSVAPVTPVTNSTKLYVAMNLSNNVKVFDTADNSLLTTIDLTPTAGAGAKSTSMGDFIGPEFPYNIVSAAQTNCSISPQGLIPVTALGRVFSVSATSGSCEVWTGATSCSPTRVGGTSQGFRENYNYVNGTANGTICAENKSGIFYTLEGDWITSVGGYLVSVPGGIDATSKSASFESPTSVTLSVGDPVNHEIQAGSWTGNCNTAPDYPSGNNTQTCTLIMNANKTFGATITWKGPILGGPVFNVTKSSYHDTVALATGAATTGDQIKVSTDITAASTDSAIFVTVKMSNQWNKSDYNSKGSYAPLTLTITNAAVIVDPEPTYQLVL